MLIQDIINQGLLRPHKTEGDCRRSLYNSLHSVLHSVQDYLPTVNDISLPHTYFYRVMPFLRRLCIKSVKCLLASSRAAAVRLSTCNSAAPTKRISAEFYIGDSYKYLLRNSRFGSYRTTISGTSHQYLSTFILFDTVWTVYHFAIYM